MFAKTKILFNFKHYNWSVLVSGGALRDVRVIVPADVRHTEDATLQCLFDLEGDVLYSVKWYKGQHEFYRFTPKEEPSMKVFPLQGLKVDVSTFHFPTQFSRRLQFNKFAFFFFLVTCDKLFNQYCRFSVQLLLGEISFVWNICMCINLRFPTLK